MNKKIIYVMLIVLGVLLVFSVILKNVDHPTGTPESLTALQMDFDSSKVAFVDVFKQDFPDSGLQFAKIDTEWVVVNAYGAPAKKDDVEKLISDLKNASGQVRGESADLYPDFDITDEKALQIEILDSGKSKLLHVYIGKGASGGETFLRVAGSPVVYLADDNFVSRFAAWNSAPEKKLPTDRWVDLTLCSIPRENIKSFKIDKGKTEYEFALIKEPIEDSLAPPTETWTQISPEKGLSLEESKIKRLYSGLAGMRASGVTDPANKDKFGLEKPGYSFFAADSAGNTCIVKFSKPVNEDEERYAVVEGKGAVYTVPKNTFDRIFVDQFKKPDK